MKDQDLCNLLLRHQGPIGQVEVCREAAERIAQLSAQGSLASPQVTDEQIEDLFDNAFNLGLGGFTIAFRALLLAPLAATVTDYGTKGAPQEAKPVAADGFAVVPLFPNREMVRVMAEDEWTWEDLLAAAEAITEAQHSAIAAASQEQAPADSEVDFYRGVIAALGVLRGHGDTHGCTIHDEIVRSVGKDELYAAAEDGDYEWAGLDPTKRPVIPQSQPQQVTK